MSDARVTRHDDTRAIDRMRKIISDLDTLTDELEKRLMTRHETQAHEEEDRGEHQR